MTFAIRYLSIGLLAVVLAGCTTERTVNGGGSENGAGVLGRIGSVFKF